MEFDKRLLALADCPVIEQKGGATRFGPHATVTAENDAVLAHEVCHVLAGKDSYDIFATSIDARKMLNLAPNLFRHILNVLYDWYHERKYENLSGFMLGQINSLHDSCNKPSKPTKSDKLNNAMMMYDLRSPITDAKQYLGMRVRDEIDLVRIAHDITDDAVKKMSATAIAGIILKLKDMASAGLDLYVPYRRSSYYLSAVSKYWHIIKELSDMWRRNRIGWVMNYYGEINWKNLVGMYLGSKMDLPVWRTMSTIIMEREVYVAVDRSGSTSQIKNLIMDTAVIITESFRNIKVPVSIIDVGERQCIINKMGTEPDLGWFTPEAENGTPLGEALLKIRGSDHNSFLIIITDGQPNNWDTLMSALHQFKGNYVTFVIGNDYYEYYRR